MKHKGTVKIETERLMLRRFVKEDTPAAFRNWTASPEVTRYLRWPAHADESVTEQVLQSWIAQYENPAFYQWAIELREIGEPIGSISVVKLQEETHTAHIGYCIGSRWWHRGYTSEAFSAVIAFLLNEVEAKRIEAQHDPGNPNSGKVMEKCGLKYEGTLRKADWNNQGIVDACLYALLADEQKP